MAIFSFLQFLSDEVQTIFGESEAGRQKLFKSKFGYRKVLTKWFWGYLELKKKYLERLKREFLSFYKFLSDENETVFWESEAK